MCQIKFVFKPTKFVSGLRRKRNDWKSSAEMESIMLRIVTDTASDMTKEEAERMNVILIPLTIFFGEENCPCETAADRERFFELLAACKELPTTSQPAPERYLEVYKAAKEAGDEVLVLCISSGLSGTYQSAWLAAGMCHYDKITVIDTRSVIMGQRMLVDAAVRMRDEGKNREEIAAVIEAVKERMVVCGVVDSLEYLKKGGRIPAALALVGTVLKIKPALIVKDGVIEQLSKSRGMKQAIEKLYELYEADGRDEAWPVYFGYVHEKEPGLHFQEETEKRYGLSGTGLYPVGATIGVHVGPGCVVMTYVKKAGQ